MKIGILLPSTLDLGLIRRARQLSLLIGELQDSDGQPWSASIGLPAKSEQEWRTLEQVLREANRQTVVRHLRWESVPVENAKRMFAHVPATIDLNGILEVTVARDWGWNFQDCDAAIVFADPNLGAVLPLVPTAFYCSDLAVRVAPRAWASSIEDPYWERQTDAFLIWRQSAVLTSDPSTVDDIISYAGVRRERVTLSPNLLDYDVSSTSHAADGGSRSLVWFTGPAALHDLDSALEGLQTYLDEGGALEPVLVHDGVRNAAFDDPSAYPQDLPGYLADVMYGLPRRRISSERALHRFLRNAGALWSSRIAGGEGEMPVLAAQAGIPFIGADYGVNRTTAERLDLGGTLYFPGDPLAIADALHELEGLIGSSKRSGKLEVGPLRANKANDYGDILRRLIETASVG